MLDGGRLRHRVSRLCVLMALFWVVGGGCQPSGYPSAALEGSVTVDGTAIDQGTISFTPLDSGAGTSVIAEIRGGRYRAEQVPLGNVLVGFQAMRETGETFMEFGVEVPQTESLIPDKYATGIEIRVESEGGEQDFELVSG